MVGELVVVDVADEKVDEPPSVLDDEAPASVELGAVEGLPASVVHAPEESLQLEEADPELVPLEVDEPDHTLDVGLDEVVQAEEPVELDVVLQGVEPGLCIVHVLESLVLDEIHAELLVQVVVTDETTDVLTELLALVDGAAEAGSEDSPGAGVDVTMEVAEPDPTLAAELLVPPAGAATDGFTGMAVNGAAELESPASSESELLDSGTVAVAPPGWALVFDPG